MANMSYCRMENTASALADCVNNWEEELSSEYEKSGKRRIIALAREIVEMDDNGLSEEDQNEDDIEMPGSDEMEEPGPLILQ